MVARVFSTNHRASESKPEIIEDHFHDPIENCSMTLYRNALKLALSWAWVYFRLVFALWEQPFFSIPLQFATQCIFFRRRLLLEQLSFPIWMCYILFFLGQWWWLLVISMAPQSHGKYRKRWDGGRLCAVIRCSVVSPSPHRASVHIMPRPESAFNLCHFPVGPAAPVASQWLFL